MLKTELMPCFVDLMQGDCLDLMQGIPDKSVNLIVCDLPYGQTQNPLDKPLPFNPLWEQYTRIIKDNGAIILFGQGLFYIDLVNSNRKLFRYDLVWNKQLTTGFLNANKMPLRQHEQIAVFYKRLPVYNPQFTEGAPLHGKGTAYKTKAAKNENYGKFEQQDDTRKGSTQKHPTSILHFPKTHPSIAQHRTEKPVTLLEWIIKSYTNEGDVVLDNCMGSGTTGVACVNTRRNFIGIELDEKYFNVAKKRLEQEDQMSKEKQIEFITDLLIDFDEMGFAPTTLCPDPEAYAIDWRNKLTNALEGYRKQSEWISVEERLPTKDEYLTHHNDGLDTLKRITIAYMTDTVEYTIGCYDGYKWINQLGNKKINDVVAWKPFELYEAPKMKGGVE